MKRITVPLDDETLERLQVIADGEDRSINVQAGRMLREQLAATPMKLTNPTLFAAEEQEIES
jgi:hypothetical protein